MDVGNIYVTKSLLSFPTYIPLKIIYVAASFYWHYLNEIILVNEVNFTTAGYVWNLFLP